MPAEPDRLPGGPALELAARYRGYLVRERGLSPATARCMPISSPGINRDAEARPRNDVRVISSPWR